MAARDIMPFYGPGGASPSVRWGTMTTGELFEAGEPVMFVDAGTLTEPTDNAAQWVVSEFTTTGRASYHGGIACFGPGGGNINPRTGIAFAAGDDIAYWPINEGIVFITSNFFAAGAAALVAPALTDNGESYQITYGTTDPIGWGVEQTSGVPGTDVTASLIEILDTNNDPIRITGLAGLKVLFTINARDIA